MARKITKPVFPRPWKIRSICCRVWAVRAVGFLQHYCTSVCVCVCVCVCLSVCSLHKCMSFKQQFEWRLHVTSRSKLLVRSGPVVVAHSCQLVSIVSTVQCSGRACSISWVVSPTLCPAGAGSFVSIVRSSCASSVLGAFHAR